MAILTAPLRVGRYSNGDYNAIYNFAQLANYSGSGSASYFHIKTDILYSTDDMVTIEAVGYHYRAAQAIRCMWSLYAYPASAPYNVGLKTIWPGMTAHGVYKSTDGYMVLRGSSSTDFYYCHFVLNGYTNAQTGDARSNISVLDSIVNTNSGNHY